MVLPLLYSDLAPLWPLLSPPEDYVPEARVLCDIVSAELRTPDPEQPLTLLELGVGGGHTLFQLPEGFCVTGVDCSPPMLENCRRLLPRAELIEADMLTLDLGRTFDVVFAHDSVDHLIRGEELDELARAAWRHTRPGGIALIAPTYDCSTFGSHETEHDQQQSEDGQLTLTYLSYVHDPDPADDTFEMILTYVVNESGTVRVIVDRCECGLFSRERWLQALSGAGFEVRVHEAEVWTLFVARRPAEPV